MASDQTIRPQEVTVSSVLKKGLIFVVLSVVTFWMVFRSLGIRELGDAIAHARMEYLVIALFCMGLFILCEALNIGRGLRIQGKKASPAHMFLYACYGFFFSAITPSSSGGQPLQIYAMHRNHIDAAQGTLALVFELMSFQIASLAFGLWGLFTHYSMIAHALGTSMIVVSVGIAANGLVLFFLFAAIFSHNLITACVRFALKVIGIFSQEKAERWGRGVGRQLEQYLAGAEMVRKHPVLFLRALATSLVQIGAVHIGINTSAARCSWR